MRCRTPWMTKTSLLVNNGPSFMIFPMLLTISVVTTCLRRSSPTFLLFLPGWKTVTVPRLGRCKKATGKRKAGTLSAQMGRKSVSYFYVLYTSSFSYYYYYNY